LDEKQQEKQLSLLDDHDQADNGPVVCLGMTFKNDEERREYFRNELRKKLPELKKIEGFPIGDDEDIIALSDPPYYTACPNPWINDFIEEWEREKKEKYGRDENEEYHREPFAADVSEGKNDPIYNAHSYHTKVPHKAIMRYILHYTQPGDIIFDGFSGTGMTGVAAQMCANPETDFKYQIEEEMPEVKWGERKAILNDLSPAATFIAYNYNFPVDINEFEKEVMRILEECEKECGWMYETNHVPQNGQNKFELETRIKGRINFTVWSDVFICPNCSEELVFWEVAVDKEQGKVKDIFRCLNCGVELKKKDCPRATEVIYDKDIKEAITIAKQVPVLINYSVGNKRYEKKPDKDDLLLIDQINNMDIPYWYPTDRMCEGSESRRNDKYGLTHIHHFYTKRNLYINSCIKDKIEKVENVRVKKLLLFGFNNVQQRHCKLNAMRFNVSFPSNVTSGTLYLPSMVRENNIFDQLKNKYVKRLLPVFKKIISKNVAVSTGSALSQSMLPDNSVDYIFTDPPFGDNLNYSELNFIWEAWLKVITCNKTEAVVNKVQGKGILEYQELMTQSFREYYRILKPNRWMTVEFSNSKASVWNAIQEAIQKAGFVIANVSALDKKQGSFKAVTTTTAVKQDLVISAYKPKTEHIEKMRREQNTEESAWTFVRQHLEQLPVFIGHKGEAQIIAERTPRILFDRMVAYHVQNGLPVPISSAEFQAKVAQRFPMRDGMVFLESQVAEYDKKRTLVKEFVQMSLFVTDETSAIEWLRQQLLKKPQTRQDLHPNFMKEIQHIAKHEKLPELDDLLEQNFLKYEGDGPVPDQIASYLRRNYKDLRGLENDDPQLKEKAMNRWYVPDPNKQADLEKLREKALLREFEGYLEELSKSKKKLKQFRTEAIRAGFKKAWSEKDYETIVKVGERLPENVIQEDDKLLMYYDNAQIRLGM
jgi:DNA modification methylase